MSHQTVIPHISHNRHNHGGVLFFPAGVLFPTENAIKTAFSKVYSGNTNINMPNKKHERKAKHQIPQKTPNTQQENTKYAKKIHQTRQKNTNYAKKNTKYAKKKTPNTPKYSKFSFTLYCREKILFQIHALFGVLFTGLKSMVVYQKGQI